MRHGIPGKWFAIITWSFYASRNSQDSGCNEIWILIAYNAAHGCVSKSLFNAKFSNTKSKQTKISRNLRRGEENVKSEEAEQPIQQCKANLQRYLQKKREFKVKCSVFALFIWVINDFRVCLRALTRKCFFCVHSRFSLLFHMRTYNRPHHRRNG